MKTLNTYYEDELSFTKFVMEHAHIFDSAANTAILVQAFCGQNEPVYLKNLAAVIQRELPSAQIIGATAFAGIMDGQVRGLKTVLSITVFQHAVIRGAGFPRGVQDEHTLGRQIAASLVSDKGRVLILFGAGMNVRFQRVLKGIEEMRPKLIIAGGNAGYNLKHNPALVFYNQEIIECGFAGLIIEGEDISTHSYSLLGWQMIGQEMTITNAKENRVYTINGLPAFQVYQRYLGIDRGGNCFHAIEFPLIVNRGGFLMAITPKIFYEDDSIGFGGEVFTGEKVRLSFGNVGLILEMMEELRQEIIKSAPEGIFVYSCESRRGFLRDLADIETQSLQKIAPTAGFFTTGEYYHRQGQNHLLNSTMTVLAMSEPSKDGGSFVNMADNAGKDDDGLPAYRDSIAERSTGSLKALAHLINAVTAELEEANKELNYIGMHDSLTEVYNRAFFDQEIKRLETLDESVGIIICDLDSLKLVNDTLGHEFGDRIICILAKVMLESCRKEDIVARIGGDEFVLLVQGVPESTIALISERIKTGVKKARRSDDLLYVSVGYAHREQNSARSLREVFTSADNAMYRYKKAYKEKIQQIISKRLERIHQ